MAVPWLSCQAIRMLLWERELTAPDNTIYNATLGDLDATKLQDKTENGWPDRTSAAVVAQQVEVASALDKIRNQARDLGLDESDINSLDLTGRCQEVQLNPGLGGNYASPIVVRRISRAPELTDVSEKEDENRMISPQARHPRPNGLRKNMEDVIIDTFSPRSQCTTSTVSNGMSLSKALASLEGDNELPLGQATPLLEEEAGGDGGNLSLSVQSKLVIDEVQQSLSSEDATLENSLLKDKSGFADQIAPEKSIVNITNKSVIFSDRTEIQAPSTPRASKFRIEEGKTKVNDGKVKNILSEGVSTYEANDAKPRPLKLSSVQGSLQPINKEGSGSLSPLEKKCNKLTKLLRHDFLGEEFGTSIMDYDEEEEEA